MTNNTMESGKVLRVIGPVVDVSFAGELPEIYTALTVERTDNLTHARSSTTLGRRRCADCSTVHH